MNDIGEATSGHPAPLFEGYETLRRLIILTTQADPQARRSEGMRSIRKQERVGKSMTFTVVRAVRGVDSTAAKSRDRLQRVIQTASPPPASMDVPYAEEIVHLDLSDFAETIPGTLMNSRVGVRQ